MPEAQSKNVRIDYSDSGQGEPALLLMPVWCATQEAFGTMIGKCAAHRRVLALDWRSHGRSGAASEDFGEEGLVEDALAVIESSGAQSVIPVALAHSGWVAIELRRRLGKKIPKLVLTDWVFLLDPPPHFQSVLRGLQDQQHWEEMRNRLFSAWLEGVSNPTVSNFVQYGMGAFGFDMWARAGREISAAYTRYGNPLRALESLDPLPVLHIYAQPADPVFYEAQRSFATEHPWFSTRRLNAISHFPMLEVPEEMAEAIEEFIST